MSAALNKPTSLAHFGALLGDPVRSAILLHLSDGSRRPAGELAELAGASPQSASAHLAQLLDSGLLSVERIGRHRFFRIASGEAAEIIEQLGNWIDEPRRPAQALPHLRQARLCYDHLAGALGVQLFERMSAKGMFDVGLQAVQLSERGRTWCHDNGLVSEPPPNSRRPMLRLCLDWTERRHHIGGHFGAALADWMLQRQYVCHGSQKRLLVVTAEGQRFLRDGF